MRPNNFLVQWVNNYVLDLIEIKPRHKKIHYQLIIIV